LPDNDEPGRKHAEQVACSLSGIAASALIVSCRDFRQKGTLAIGSQFPVMISSLSFV